MGLFFNTRTDKIKNEIKLLIGNINASIRELVTEMDRNEITLTNQKAILSNLTYINQNREKVNSLLQQLTPSQTDSLRVPWLDGRMLPIFMYDGSYRLVMTRIDAEINQTLEKLLKEEQQRQEERRRQEEQRRQEEERKRQEEQRRKEEEAIQRELTKEYNKLNTSITAETLESYISLSICCKTDVIIDWGDNTKTKVSCTDKYNEISKSCNSKGNHKITIKGETIKLNCLLYQLTSLDVSKNTALTSLGCSCNRLTSLDVSKCTALADLHCRDNQLTSLNVSKNTALTELSCWNNQLTSLNVSGCAALTWLCCSNNHLTSLDISKCTALTYLSCYSNQLTSLNVSKNTALTELSCWNNQLTSLDVSKNTALIRLWCENNQLTSLDVSKNTALTGLDCPYNQLTSLDVSKNTKLTYLNCSDNQLTSLDISKNTELTSMNCDGNPFTAEEMNKIYEALPNVGYEYGDKEPKGKLKCDKLGDWSIAEKKGWKVTFPDSK